MVGHRFWLRSFFAIAVFACGDGDEPAATFDALPFDGGGADASSADIAVRLSKIPGMTVIEEFTPSPDKRYLRLTYVQPVDHQNPDGPTFTQRMTLLHQSETAPFVLHTSGYDLYDEFVDDELTLLLGANQLSTEQRYFGESRPDPLDWSFLTIEQAAADHHRIVAALRDIYTGVWLSTGASKGGMTSIYHRRFYPDDVDVTVPYVAPMSFGAPDDRYLEFFATTGTRECREKMQAFGQELLSREAGIVPLMDMDAATFDFTFDLSGGTAAAFEDAVADFWWSMWQYGDESWCDLLPGQRATDAEMYQLFNQLGGLYFYTDASIRQFLPYYVQAETQLGYPELPDQHLRDFYTQTAVERVYLPAGIEGSYDASAMQDIDSWTKHQDAKMLFIYGQYDPWSFAKFNLDQATQSTVFVAPQANHGASIADLTEPDRQAALALLSEWTGIDVTSTDLGAFHNQLKSSKLRRIPPPRLRMRTAKQLR